MIIGIDQTLADYSGEALMPNGQFHTIRLAEYRGKWVVLFFWPLDFTFVCPTEIRAFNDLATEFDAGGAVLLGASVDSVYTHRAWTEHGLGKMRFPLIGDVTRELARSFGVLLEQQGVAARGTFIIDPEGNVKSVSVNALNVGRSARETLRLLQALQSGQLTACDWQPGQPFVKAA